VGAAQVQDARKGLVLDTLQFHAQMLLSVLIAQLSSLANISPATPSLSKQLNSGLDQLFPPA
jgi:hypothetical protein